MMRHTVMLRRGIQERSCSCDVSVLLNVLSPIFVACRPQDTLSPRCEGLQGTQAPLSIIVACMQACCMKQRLGLYLTPILRPSVVLVLHPESMVRTPQRSCVHVSAACYRGCVPSQLKSRALCSARQCCKAAGMCVIIGLRLPRTLQGMVVDYQLSFHEWHGRKGTMTPLC